MTSFWCVIFHFSPMLCLAQEEKEQNTNKIIDSLYKLNQLYKIITIHEIGFRNRENNIGSNLHVQPINTGEVYGHNSMSENDFLFIKFNSKSLPSKNKIESISIKINITIQDKVIDTKRYIWMPNYDGDYYIWLPLEKKYFSCITTESKIKIDLVDDKTKVLINSNVIKYDTYCETD